MLARIKRELARLGSSEKARNAERFFKTGKGEYAEGDVFLGVSMSDQRRIARAYQHIPCSDIKALFVSTVHEHRMVGGLILAEQFLAADFQQQTTLFDFYVAHARRMNNWDLVDSTAPIFGRYLLTHRKPLLKKLATSDDLWERRIAIVATYAGIKEHKFGETLAVSEMLLSDTHDLIHKAVGWMLRELGKRDQKTLELFLKKHYNNIPRTTLRYAIERFPEKKRKRYLSGTF